MTARRGRGVYMITGEGDMETRIEALEIKVSYQEKTIAELSSLVYEQSLQVERLDRALRDLGTKFKELAEEGLPGMPSQEKPPHY
jgi:SlyX protein